MYIYLLNIFYKPDLKLWTEKVIHNIHCAPISHMHHSSISINYALISILYGHRTLDRRCYMPHLRALHTDKQHAHHHQRPKDTRTSYKKLTCGCLVCVQVAAEGSHPPATTSSRFRCHQQGWQGFAEEFLSIGWVSFVQFNMFKLQCWDFIISQFQASS